MRSFRPARALPALALVVLATVAASAAPCSRVVAVGDLHGGYEAFVSILRETGLLDDGGKWSDGEACLVQTGDVVDRGPRSREILDLLIRLDSEAPGRVHPLLGNHEVMNLTDDLRYVATEEYAAFAGEETAEEREAGYQAWAAGGREPAGDEAALRAAFDGSFPPGWFAHRRAFSKEGRYGKWLLTRPVLLSLEGSLFVHGGVDPADAPRGVSEIDGRVRTDLAAYLEVREALERAGWLDPFVPFGEEFARVERRLATELAAGAKGEPIALAERFLVLRANRFAAEDGPLWTRRLAIEDETALAPAVETMLRELGVSRIVVGHTPTDDGRIRARFDGRVFVIDTGAGPTYGGRVSALEIRGGVVRAVYPGESEVLFRRPALPDRDIERFLLEAEVVESEEIPTGITKPMKVVLAAGGVERKAAFKTVDFHRSGVTRFEGSRPEMNFSDNYRYDRAAYLLDRMLGMRMVPVVVLRTLEGRNGALVDWVEDAIDEQKRTAEGRTPSDPDRLDRQRALMELFDALIDNRDRNLGNQLFTKHDLKLHLIDHTRAFRAGDALSEKFERRPARLPRPVYERLLSLEEKPLAEAMQGLLGRAQVRALLKRRDRIVRKIEKDRERLGDETVFY